MKNFMGTGALASDVVDAVDIGDEIVVRYDSQRGNRVVTREGNVTALCVDRVSAKIEIKTKSGTVITVDSFGRCKTPSSHHPYNGDLTEIILLAKERKEIYE